MTQVNGVQLMSMSVPVTHAMATVLSARTSSVDTSVIASLDWLGSVVIFLIRMLVDPAVVLQLVVTAIGVGH